MQGLIHFYYGDRLKAFEIGLGTIIRSEGHSIPTITVIFNDSYEWIANVKNKNLLDLKLVNQSEYKDYTLDFFRKLFSKKNKTILIVNLDLLLKSNTFLIEEFINLIEESELKNDLIITSDANISELTSVAHYVSLVSSE